MNQLLQDALDAQAASEAAFKRYTRMANAAITQRISYSVAEVQEAEREFKELARLSLEAANRYVEASRAK